LKGETGNS
jgi:seryl-tRNA synthetase